MRMIVLRDGRATVSNGTAFAHGAMSDNAVGFEVRDILIGLLRAFEVDADE